MSYQPASNPRFIFKALDLHTATGDLASIQIPASITRWEIRTAAVVNPSGAVAAATLGLYSASGGGGTAMVAPVTLVSLTGSATKQSLTPVVLTTPVTTSTLYVRLTIVSVLAGTADLVVELIDLTT